MTTIGLAPASRALRRTNGLSLGTICRIDDEQDAVDHVHDSLNFAPKSAAGVSTMLMW